MEVLRSMLGKRIRRSLQLFERLKFTVSLLLLLSAFVLAQTSLASPKAKVQMKSKTPDIVFSAAGLKDTEGLRLKQEYRFIGKCTTYFSPLGISVESNTISILFNAKTLNLCLFSNDTKKYYACDPETWKKKSKVLFRNPNQSSTLSPWKFLRNEKICGMGTKVFSRVSKAKDLTNVDTIWVTNEIKMTPDARALLFSLLKVADSVPPGVPLRHSLSSKHAAVRDAQADYLGRHRVRKAKDTDRVDYETYSIEKIKIPFRKYVMPTGYAKAENEMEVFFSTDDSFGDLNVPELGSDKSNKMLQQKFK